MQRTILNKTVHIHFHYMKPKTDTESVNDKQPDGGSGLLGGLLGGLFSKPTQNQVNQNVSFTHNIFHTLSDTL